MPVSAEGRPPKRRVVALAGIVCSMALLFSVAISRGTASWSLTISPEPATDRFQLMSEVPAAAGAVSLFRSVNATGSSLRVRAPWQLTTLPVQAGMPNDTAIIMAYFNPVKWTRPSMNMHKTRAMLITQGASLYTIELLYPNRTPEVPPGPGVLHVHTRSIMWHKENLLTILERRLPSQYTKVIWVDCDVEFNNPRWIAEASVALERYDYVQPYDTACWLGPGLDRSKCIMTKTSFGYKRRHPGFAGGFRRDFLRRIGGGFLGDYVITGGGDALMALLLGNRPLSDFRDEGYKYLAFTGIPFDALRNATHSPRQARIGYVPGQLYHYFHGSFADRRYTDRYKIMLREKIRIKGLCYKNADGVWEYNDKQRERVNAIVFSFFRGRKEDSISRR